MSLLGSIQVGDQISHLQYLVARLLELLLVCRIMFTLKIVSHNYWHITNFINVRVNHQNKYFQFITCGAFLLNNMLCSDSPPPVDKTEQIWWIGNGSKWVVSKIGQNCGSGQAKMLFYLSWNETVFILALTLLIRDFTRGVWMSILNVLMSVCDSR